MRIYVALGDSISIDDYTGVRGGGAASQLARKLNMDLVDLTRDGNTTYGVLADLARVPAAADVVTLTAGGNDLLSGQFPRAIQRRLEEIARRIEPLGARVVISSYLPGSPPPVFVGVTASVGAIDYFTPVPPALGEQGGRTIFHLLQP